MLPRLRVPARPEKLLSKLFCIDATMARLLIGHTYDWPHSVTGVQPTNKLSSVLLSLWTTIQLTAVYIRWRLITRSWMHIDDRRQEYCRLVAYLDRHNQFTWSSLSFVSIRLFNSAHLDSSVSTWDSRSDVRLFLSFKTRNSNYFWLASPGVDVITPLYWSYL